MLGRTLCSLYVGMIGAAVVLVRGTASAAAAQQSAMLVGLRVVAHDALAVCGVVAGGAVMDWDGSMYVPSSRASDL